MSNLQPFQHIFGAVNATIIISMTILGGSMLSLYVADTTNNKTRFAASYESAYWWIERMRSILTPIKFATPWTTWTLDTYLDANEDALQVYRHLAQTT